MFSETRRTLVSAKIQTQQLPLTLENREAIGDLWHPQLRNLAGPWDRSYGFDTTRYFSLLSMHLWNIVGKEYSALPESVNFRIEIMAEMIVNLQAATNIVSR
tara:strand:+ start:87 stop:392 length:306 start_codon:yes stop_codon:yes gene_type:complete